MDFYEKEGPAKGGGALSKRGPIMAFSKSLLFTGGGVNDPWLIKVNSDPMAGKSRLALQIEGGCQNVPQN